MGTLTAAGLELCIALMGAAPSNPDECVRTWWEKEKAKPCAEKLCAYVAMQVDRPFAAEPGFDCFRFEEAVRVRGTLGTRWMCHRRPTDEKSKP